MQIGEHVHALLVTEVDTLINVDANYRLFKVLQNIFKHFLLLDLRVEVLDELVMVVADD